MSTGKGAKPGRGDLRWGDMLRPSALVLAAFLMSGALAGCGGANEADVALITGTTVPDASPTAPVVATALGAVTVASRISFQAGSEIEFEMFDEEGRCLVNATSDIISLVGDYRGRAIPQGTPIGFFVATGRGIIEGEGRTDASGLASATFRSLCPVNARDNIILVAAVRGAEPFVDLNSNGRYDSGETFVDLDREAFLDANTNGTYEPQLGEYLIWDANRNGRFDAGGNGVYDKDNIIVDDAILIPVRKMGTPGPGTPGTPGTPGPGTPGTPTTPEPTIPPPSATVSPTPSQIPAFLQVALFVNAASNNNDGTLSSVITAQVSDKNGVALDGVPVRFRILPPVRAGVSVTSPVLSGDRLACSLGADVPGQPGNALSCVQYDSTLQGEAVTIEARAQGASGDLVSSQTIVLPDIRPLTLTPVSTRTVTITPTPQRVPKFLQVALYNNLTSSNSDGTYSTALTALVSDKEGVALDNVQVNFRLLDPVGPGVIVTSPGITGAPLPCVIQFPPPIPPPPPQPGDALTCLKYNTELQGSTVTLEATVATPNGLLVDTIPVRLPVVGVSSPEYAKFLQIALYDNLAQSNNDGTYTTVLSALVSTEDGVALPGLNVEFKLLPPVGAGVVVISPGITGAELPCVVDFAVRPARGAALTCLKYNAPLGGQSVSVEARLVRPTGDLVSSQVLVLPDFRIPTRSPTATPTLVLPTGTATASPSPTVTFQASSIHFVRADPARIGVRQSGQIEQSTLTFRVSDLFGSPIPNVRVAFQLTAIGGEHISPTETFSNGDGIVSTVLTSGTRAAPVRVSGGADIDGDGAPDVFAQSTQIAVVGGPPAFNRFSVGAGKRNVPGRVTLGLEVPIRTFVNDRFGNAVPAGTAVSFVSNGASVVNPVGTDQNGAAQATLLTEGGVPSSGIVTVLAFTRGEESFRDTNGDGVFQAALDEILSDNVPEPYVDYRPLAPGDGICPIAPPASLCNDRFDATQTFDLFVDSDRNGSWNTQGQAGVWDNNVLVFDTVAVTFSGHLVTPVLVPSTFSISDGGAQRFVLRVHDDLLNPLVEGSRINISVTAGNVVPATFILPDGHSFNQIVRGLTEFEFIVRDPSPGDSIAPEDSSIIVSVDSANGVGSFILATGTLD